VGHLELDQTALRGETEAADNVITGIVLAAGTSSRFGATKQILQHRGKPLVQHAVDAAAGAGLEEIVVVLGHDADRVRAALSLPANACAIVNPRYGLGQSTSLAAGLEAAHPGSQAAVVLLADQPGVAAEHVRRLVDAFRPGRSRIVRLRFRDGPGPSLLSREVWDPARALEGDTGARTLIDAHPDWVEEVAIAEDAPLDVDTPEDADALG
jgi:molybdenum cofactor cytidylyltransferase